MSKIIFYLLFLLAVAGITWLVHAGIRKSRYGKEERFLHCRYLVVYLLLLVIFCNRYSYSDMLLVTDALINSYELSEIWAVVLPQRRYELVYLMLSFIFTNLLLLLITGVLFNITKLLFIKCRKFIDTRDMELHLKIFHFPWVITSTVYKENEDAACFCVTDRGFTMSLWAKKMKFAFLIWGVIEISYLTVGIFSAMEFFETYTINLIEGLYLLPIAGYILFEQIQYYLEGTVEYEAGSYGSEDVSERLEGNMDALLYLYKEEFKNSRALLNSYVWKDLKVIRDGLMHNGLNKNQLDECMQPEILMMLNNQLKEAGVSQNTGFQNALIALLNEKSINVRDYIQGEFLDYLAAYMNFWISQERTFLVLCKNRTEAQKIKKEIENAMQRINKIYGIWRIADIDNADSNEEMSILICSYRDFVNHKLVAKRQDFFRTLLGVVLTDGAEFCAQGNVQNKLIFAELAKLKQKLQYILLSKIDSDSLRTAFEHYTNRELYPFKNDQLQNNMYVMIWAEDSSNKIQRSIGIGQSHSPYLGAAIPLALVAAKYDIPRIHIFSNGKKGYHTYQDAMTMSYQEILGYLGCNLDLEKMIRYNHFSVKDRSEIEMLILYDSEFNFYNLLWAWMKYGGRHATMVHIVAPPYMLREYFAANMKALVLRNNDFDALISYRSSLKHTRFLNLLLELCNTGVDEEELMKRNKEYHWGYANAIELLSDCLKDVLNTQEFYNIYECFKFEEYCSFDMSEDTFVHKIMVKLTDENIRKRIQGLLVFAKLVTKNNVVESIPILKGNIYNYCLRGQIIPINGYMQRIISVNDGMIVAEQMMVTDKKNYLQIGEFVFSNMYKTDECVDLDILDFNLYTADVERFVYGYWATNTDVAFLKEGAVRMHSICDSQGNPIHIQNRDIQILQIRMKKSLFAGKEEQISVTAGFMFQEIFKTLFPENHMNLFAIVEYNPQEMYWEKMLRDSSNASLDEKVHSMIPFVRVDERTQEMNREYVTVYVAEYSSLELGMISSLYANRMKLFQIAAAYLEWYLQTDSGGTYLNLGGEGIAPCFAAEEFLDYCKKVLPVYEEVEKKDAPAEVPVQTEYVCSFCGRPALFTYRMEDGRKMCRSCKQQQISQREEIKDLYHATRDFMCRGYNIKLRRNIHLRFKSAESIKKHCNTPAGGRILGFYQWKIHELWIEARGPKNAVQDTIIHELTHAWQFDNLDMKKLNKADEQKVLQLLEGHASYMEIDAMRKLGETEFAEYMEKRLMLREDEYGQGYRMLKDYLEEKESEGSHWTPFEAMKELVENM